MKFRIIFVLLLVFAAGAVNPTFAQRANILKSAIKGGSKLLKWTGKKAVGGIVATAGGYAFKKHFLQDNDRYININVVNNYNNSRTIWVTTNGQNWTQYNLKSEYYFAANSNNSGYIGIYDGYSYSIVHSSGTYYVSQF